MSPPNPPPLALPDDLGSLGVFQLKRLWSRAIATRDGARLGTNDEWSADRLVLDALGAPIETTIRYLYSTGPSFEDFEAFLVASSGAPAPETVARLNAALVGAPPPESAQARMRELEAMPAVLDADDHAFFAEHGYVVVRHAIGEEEARRSASRVRERVGATDDPATFYGIGDNVMLPFLRDPVLDANRDSRRIEKAFAELSGTADLWPETGRALFHPPEQRKDQFIGLGLRWDVSLAVEVPLELRGLLYLVDVEDEGGAFRCVPGFHLRLAEWLASLPKGADPRAQDLEALGAKSIGGRAGDLVLWHQAVPHGHGENFEATPSIAQFVSWRRYERRSEPAWR